jgi:hypothetical protein
LTLFLSHNEIAQLTGYVRSADQIKWLRSHGFKFEVNAKGMPVVLRPKEEAPGMEPNFPSMQYPANLLDKETLIGRSQTVQRICAVYFLISDNEIVYVGCSTDFNARLISHIGTKQFDRYAYIHCEQEDLPWLEKLYIAKFKPKLNVVVPTFLIDPDQHIERIEEINAANN